MSTELNAKNQLFLAKIETTKGTDASPTAAANAILVSELTAKTLAGQSIDLNYIRASFGNSPKLRVDDYQTYGLTCDVAGSGTAGTAPAWDPLIRAAACAKVTQAVAVTGTAQAGAASSITLAAGASSTADYFVGLPVTITSGTGSGQTRQVKAYNGTTKVATIFGSWAVTPDNTSQYSLPAFVAYSPVSSGIESCSLYRTLDSLLFRSLSAHANASFSLTAAQRPGIKFDFTGTYTAPDDGGAAAASGLSYTPWKTPVPVSSANTSGYFLGFAIDGSVTGLQVAQFSLDLGIDVQKRQVIGSEKIVVADRKSKAQLTMDAIPVAMKAVHEAIRTVEQNPLLITHGASAGNRVAIFCPSVSIDDLDDGEDKGVATWAMNLSVNPVSANDEFRILTF